MMKYDMIWSHDASEKRRNRKFRIFDQVQNPPRYHIEYEDGSQESISKENVHLGAKYISDNE